MLSTFEMLKALASIGVPIIMSFFFGYVVEIMNIFFIGNYGTSEMISGVGIGNMLLSMTSIGPVVGINSAMATLVSQAFGQGNLRLCGVYLNRARFIIFLYQIPIALLLAFSGKILTIMGIEEGVAYYTQQYLSHMIPGMFFYSQADCVRGFSSYIQKAHIPLIVAIISGVFHVFWSWLFIFYLDLGVLGAAYASNLTFFLNLFLMTIILTLDSSIREGWFRPGLESFSGLKEYLEIAIPNGVMTLFEFWAFNMLTLMSGYLPVDQTSAQIIVMNLVALFFMFPLGISIAAAALVGKEIGQGNKLQALKFSKVIQTYGLTQSILLMVGFYILREPLVNKMTDIPDVQAIAIDAIKKVVALVSLFDHTQAIQGGIIRGMGKSKISAIACFIGYYSLAIPFGAFFAFKQGLGVQGLWTGMLIGLVFINLLFQYVISFRYDWDVLIKESRERTLKEEQNDCQRRLLDDELS